MKNHGTASEFPGWYVEFQTAVLRNLPRPEKIDESFAREWTDNGKALSAVLAGVLVPPQVRGNIFSSTVGGNSFEKYSETIKGRPCGGCNKLLSGSLGFWPHKYGWVVDGLPGRWWLAAYCDHCTYGTSLWKIGVPGCVDKNHDALARETALHYSS